MATSVKSDIKKAQKESLLFKEISKLFHEITSSNPNIKNVFISKVVLSADKGHCTVLFYSPSGEEHFEKILEILKLYRPSIRKALAAKIKSRYTPEIVFKFDKQFEKQSRIEHLLDQIKESVPAKDKTSDMTENTAVDKKNEQPSFSTSQKGKNNKKGS